MLTKIQQHLKELTGNDWPLEKTADAKFGDYSSNVAFRLAKERKMPPMAVAESLAKEIAEKDKGKFFTQVVAAAPGFINFTLAPDVLREELLAVLKQKAKYGAVALRQAPSSAKASAGRQGLKINVEFVSANPTGPLTMANGRGGFLGDVLANVLECAGHKVTREYYVNDAGNQVRLLGESIQAAEGKLPEKEEYYKGEYIKELKGKTGKQAVALLLKSIKASLKKAGIIYDVFFSEEENLRAGGELEKMLAFLEQKGLVERKEGAVWFGDKVLIKSDNTPTYFLPDLAYHYDKLFKRKFDVAIDIWGADHHGYAEQIKKGVAALGVAPERLKIIITQLVRLVSGGKEVRMSKRKGEFVTMDELLEEVGADAARFFFLMNSAGSHMDFDLDLAKERSVKNPVYYVQYAYVRAGSVLEKAKKQRNKEANITGLKEESELKLLKTMAEFPDVIAQTAADYEVHRLTRYATDLARAFHDFYEKERVIDSSGAVVTERLQLVEAARMVLENVLRVLGVSAPEKM
ncbi:MAG: arginine--tRNA ligase [bacterium]|nr:arginine--tRNA ligase [bacterium]